MNSVTQHAASRKFGEKCERSIVTLAPSAYPVKYGIQRKDKKNTHKINYLWMEITIILRQLKNLHTTCYILTSL